MQEKLHSLIEKVKLLLETDKNLGIEEYFIKSAEKPKPVSDKIKINSQQEALDRLKDKVLKCKECPLYKTRTNLVFGEGNPKADLMFVGEAPGRNEDIEGRPFVGRAGQLLSRIIGAMNLERKDVYIANILKDRPPNNRNPKEEEILHCLPYLLEQIDIIQPKVICTLGSFATKELLYTDKPISKIRGTFYRYKNSKLMPTFHPAYLLRNPKDKKLVWEDMKKIMKELNIEIKHDS